MKKLLYLLHTTPITDPQYQWTFHQLIKAFNKHIIKFGLSRSNKQIRLFSFLFREEEILISKLENDLSKDLFKSLSNSFEKTQKQNQRKYSSLFNFISNLLFSIRSYASSSINTPL